MKKVMKSGLLVAACAVAGSLAGCSKPGDWYDYGNGKVNLANVSMIRPRIDYELTLATDPVKDVGKDYSEPLTKDAVERLVGILTQETLAKQDFYRVRFNIYVMFDTFQLELFKSEDYVKRPSKYEVNDHLLAELRGKNADEGLLGALAGLKGKVYGSREDFVKALAATNQLNMQNWWVQNELPELGLGEAGVKFAAQVKAVEEDKLLDEAQLKVLRTGIQDALEAYQDIPAR